MNTELLDRYGLATAIIIVGGVFFWKVFWPWITKQVEISQKQTEAAITALAGLKETLVQHTELSRQMVDMLKDINREGRK